MTLKGGITGLFVGPPGTGKSWLLGTAAQVAERPLLLAAKPREINSFQYIQQDIATEIFHDYKWAPPIDSFETGGYLKLYRRVLELYEDTEYDAILLDPLTDVCTMAEHELLEPERAAAPNELRDPLSFWFALRTKLESFTQALTRLASPDLARPKHVFVAVHAQPTKEEDIKGKETAEANARGIEFMGEALPMLAGSYRRKVMSEFDIVGFTKVQHKMHRVGNKMEKVTDYVVQLNADPERHAKAALIPRMAQAEIPNSLVELFRVIEESRNG